jgi:hypothetical protein
MITEAMPRTPQDVPGLRRGIAEFMANPELGPQWYERAIRLGQQTVCPDLPAPHAGRVLAACEYRRLADARLWFIDGDLCDLVEQAFPTMPAFPVRPPDLPSPSGFVVFAKPVALLTRDRIDTDLDTIAELLPGSLDNPTFRGQVGNLLDGGVRIVGVSWGPMNVPGMSISHWPAGGVWLTFYAESDLDHIGDPQTAAVARKWLPPMSPDNECTVAWCPPGLTVAEQAPYILPMEEGFTSRWAALLFATFQIHGQDNLTEEDPVPVARAERRRHDPKKLPVPAEIRVVRLRRKVRDQVAAAGGPATVGGRTYRHRWIVGAHWRNVWYSSTQTHKPRLILPYLVTPKGAEDAPLLGGEKVTRVGP